MISLSAANVQGNSRTSNFLPGKIFVFFASKSRKIREKSRSKKKTGHTERKQSVCIFYYRHDIDNPI